MLRFVIAVALALPGLFGGGTALAGCGCGCSCRSKIYSQPAFGPGSYRFWDRQNSCWLFYDAATKGTYFWSPVEQRYQPVRSAAPAPSGNAAAPGGSGNDHHDHQHAEAAASAAPAHCPNCAATRPATPVPLPALPTPVTVPPAPQDAAGDGHQGHQHAPATPRGSAEPLPPPKQAAAPYGGQKLCPVTDEELGSMGAPIPVMVRGQTIWVCCRGCVAKVQRDPNKYLRKVEAERAGQQLRRP